MIIGGDKVAVIENIKIAANSRNLNQKVELGDPSLSCQEQEEIITNYFLKREKIGYKFNSKIAKIILNTVTNIENKDTEIVGIENIKNIKSGGIVTSNHFNPLDSTIIQKLIKDIGKKKLYIIAQATNLAMEGFLGFMMNHVDIIPVSKQLNYLKGKFPKVISEILERNNFILIYPEEEMWFNYRKPRTLKNGAYYYAAKNNVPVISCFTEIIDDEELDNEQFHKVKYVLHVLPPIYPDSNKTIKENSRVMMEKDYEQKRNAYEKAYNKKLDYTFEISDIAGFVKK